MILDFIINLYIDIYYELLQGIPYAVFPDGWLEAFATIQSTLSQLQTVLPVDVALSLMYTVIFIETAIIIFKLGNSFYTKVRGGG